MAQARIGNRRTKSIVKNMILNNLTTKNTVAVDESGYALQAGMFVSFLPTLLLLLTAAPTRFPGKTSWNAKSTQKAQRQEKLVVKCRIVAEHCSIYTNVHNTRVERLDSLNNKHATINYASLAESLVSGCKLRFGEICE